MANIDSFVRERNDLSASISANLKQLRAMLLLTYGLSEESEGIRCLGEERRDEFMWACSDKVDAILEAWDKLDRLKGEGAPR